jgi:hypothetical protein
VRCTLGIGIIDRLGGRGGGEEMPDGVSGRKWSDENDRPASESVLVGESSAAEDAVRWCIRGVGIWLGVFGRERGVTAGTGTCDALDEEWMLEMGGMEAIDEVMDVFTGDHGREDAIELREALRM